MPAERRETRAAFRSVDAGAGRAGPRVLESSASFLRSAMVMEGKKNPVGVDVVVGGGNELGDAEAKRQVENGWIEEQQEEGIQQGGEEEDWNSGSDGGDEEWPQLSPQMQMMALQELVNACRAVLKDTGIPPTDDAISFIRGAMAKVGMFDVGLMDEVGFFYNRNSAGRENPPVLTCKKLYKCPSFTVMVLYLPTGVATPLHDHPGTTVLSKLLVGSARVEAFAWAPPRASAADHLGSALLAEKTRDDEVTVPSAAGTWVFLPDSGGRRLAAGRNGPCVFLDVHVPIHSGAVVATAACAFFQDSPYESHPNDHVRSGEAAAEKKRRLAWLQKVEEPKDVKVVSLPYQGPPLV